MKTLKEILDTVMATCAEYDLKEKRPTYQVESKQLAYELHNLIEPIRMRFTTSATHMDWNVVLLWALNNVMKAQLNHDPKYHNDELTYELANLLALVTLWIRANEERLPSGVKGRLANTTQFYIDGEKLK